MDYTRDADDDGDVNKTIARIREKNLTPTVPTGGNGIAQARQPATLTTPTSQVSPPTRSAPVPRLDKRGVLRELDRLLPLYSPLGSQLARFQLEFLAVIPISPAMGRMELATQCEEVQAALRIYPLDHAAAGHALRLMTSRRELQEWDPSWYARALQQLALPASSDLISRILPAVNVLKEMMLVVDSKIMPGWWLADPKVLDDTLDWRSALTGALGVGLAAVGLISLVRRAEGPLREQVDRFHCRWVAREAAIGR